MTRLSFSIILFLGCVVPVAASHAGATSFQGVQQEWKQMDRCAHDAFVKFPDATPESVAKRQAAERKCDRDHRVPERQSQSQAPKS